MIVSDAIRAAVHKEAKALWDQAKASVPGAAWSQDLCAMTCNNVCTDVERSKATAEEKLTQRLQVMYICTNSSALGQALTSEKKSKASAISNSLMSMVRK